jgi:hypothetical protein
MPPRRRSKLAKNEYGVPPKPDDATPENPSIEVSDQDDQRTPDPQTGERLAATPVTRNPRRLRVVGKVTDEDLVSFNCKMSRGLRREVRHFAADAECDIQDVVAAALAEYLVTRGRHIPASELHQPG